MHDLMLGWIRVADKLSPYAVCQIELLRYPPDK
jgi:hypothetical protein